jgi:quercetin dioxygenase-like cupin family protein
MTSTIVPATVSAVAPELAAQIEDAPGKGILPGVSLHLAAEPQLFGLDTQPMEKVSDLISRQYRHGTSSTFVKWTVKKGAVIPLHHHPNEQITWFTEGLAEVFSQGRRYRIKAGDIMIIPPNVPHEFRFLADTIDIDIFAPGRQDWLDGTASYLNQK